MATFDSIKDAFNKGVATVSIKSETLVESSRVKTAISTAQKRRDTEIAALGVKFYAAWKRGEITDSIFADDLQAIAQIEQEIAQQEERLVQIKAEEDKALNARTAPKAAAPRFCTKCGKPLTPGSRFCTECGAPVE